MVDNECHTGVWPPNDAIFRFVSQREMVGDFTFNAGPGQESAMVLQLAVLHVLLVLLGVIVIGTVSSPLNLNAIVGLTLKNCICLCRIGPN